MMNIINKYINIYMYIKLLNILQVFIKQNILQH